MKNKKKIGIRSGILLLGLGYITYLFVLAPSKSLQPIYAIPEDAIYFMATEKPIENWKKISNSALWEHLKGHPYLDELTTNTNRLDTLIHSNPKLFKLLGSRSLMISAHMTTKNDYDFLFVIDLQKIAKLKQLKAYLGTLLDPHYKLHQRSYKDYEIIEIFNKKDKETLSLAWIENLLVASYTGALTEAALDQFALPVIGRDLHYQEIRKQIREEEGFQIYLQHRYFDDFSHCFVETTDPHLQYLSNSLWYSGLAVALEQDHVIARGHTNINEEYGAYLKALQESGSSKRTIPTMAPQRTAFYLGLGFDNFGKFHNRFLEILQAHPKDFQRYQEHIHKIEQFLKIDLQQNFVDWIDDEIAFLQLQPSNLGKKNEFAVILKTKDQEQATKNLDFILKQIKKKTPVKFREVSYKGYRIKFMAIKGFFKLILGKFFEELEKPYFVIMDDYVIFSNHPQTLKNFINDYEGKRTLANAPDFEQFDKRFKKSSCLFAYSNTPLLFQNLKSLVGPKTQIQLKKNKKYITCFPQIGFQLIPDESLFETKLVLQYLPPKEQAKKIQFTEKPWLLSPAKQNPKRSIADGYHQTSNTNRNLLEMVEEEELILVSEISPDDLNAKKYTETYPDGQLKVEVPIKKGMKHGTYRSYHPNGTIKLKGRYKKDLQIGIWKAYDDQGHRLERRRF